MSQNYYISDLHFGHNNIISFDGRPFEDVDEMEEVLVNNWNSVVTNEDHVYHLGDFCWGKTDEWIRILKRLNGNIHIIKGNHDLKGYSSQLKKLLAEVTDYKEIEDNGRKLILCHYPILFYKGDYLDNVFMLCGHLHLTKEYYQMRTMVRSIRNSWTKVPDNRGQIIPVECCKPWMNYMPQTLDYLIQCLDKGLIHG